MTKAREKRLYSFCAPILKADAPKNAVLACSILEEVLDDPNDAFRVVEEDLGGLPLCRWVWFSACFWFLVRGVDIPELGGRRARSEGRGQSLDT
jgi:hypothetical protein